MPKTLRYRLLKIGAMPEALLAEIAKEQVLFFDEGIAVTVRRKGSAPGFRGSATGKFSGAFAVTSKRIIASISKTIMVDAPYAANAASDAQTAQVSLTADGLHVKVDATVNPRCTGEIAMHFKHDFTREDLAGFPEQQLGFNFASELVPKIFGVPG